MASQGTDPPVQLSPAPRGNNRTSRKAGKGRGSARSRAGHSPITSSMPLPGSDGVFDSPSEAPVNDSRANRRQLPNGRSGQAVRGPTIVEEEEEEEE